MRRLVDRVAAVLLALPDAALAQDYPTRPVSMVVAAAAGGPIDVFTRIMAERMSPILGQRVIVENIGGGGGTLGGQRVAQGRAGRLHDAARHGRHPRQSAALRRQAAVRPAHRFHAGGADRGNPAGGDRAQGFPGEHVPGVHRLRQGQPGQAELRLGRRRLGLASRLRHARPGDGHQCPARAVSRHRAGDAGPDRRGGSIFSATSR